MLKNLLLILSLSGPFAHTFSQNYWEQRDSVNGSGKGSSSGFVLDGEGYILGGLDDFGFKRKMYSFDQFQDDWDDEVSIGGASGDGLDRASACSFSIADKGYLCLGQGQTNPYFQDLWEYDPQTDVWTQKADFIGSARRQAVSFTINNIAYVGTGQDISGLTKDFYKYDPLLNTWTQLNDFPGTARRQAVGFSMGAEGYIGTGDDGVLKNDFWMYNAASDSWIQKANFPGTPRSGATGWGIFPTGFIATGEDINFDYRNDVWEYNYFGNVWVQRADFIGPGRKNAVSFVIDGIAFLGTGYNGTFLDDFYAYHGIVGLDENEKAFSSQAYPIPATNSVTISFEIENIKDLAMEIYSINGQNVTSNVSKTVNANNIHLNTVNLPAGCYFYKLKNSSNSVSTGKLVII